MKIIMITIACSLLSITLTTVHATEQKSALPSPKKFATLPAQLQITIPPKNIFPASVGPLPKSASAPNLLKISAATPPRKKTIPHAESAPSKKASPPALSPSSSSIAISPNSGSDS